MLLGVDVGGTFTDAVLVGADGAVYTAKVPTTPADQAQGVLEAVSEVLARAGAAPGDVTGFAHGMTVATNALLEGAAARTALIATAGLHRRDRAGPPGARAPVPAVRRARRRRWCRRSCATPRPSAADPTARCVALDPERGAASWSRRSLAAEPEAVAVALLHSYAHPEHERLLARLLRGAAAREDARVGLQRAGRHVPRVRAHRDDRARRGARARSSGATCAGSRPSRPRAGWPSPRSCSPRAGSPRRERAASHAALTVLSGPAGGVGGALLLAGLAGEENVLCFDMGGTSCDVCLISGGQVAETAQRTVAGRPLALPALDIHTVGAGGGSIAWRDAGGALRVGPESAGAVPGPACYGRGGERPTVTDANLLLGRLPAGRAAGGRAAAGPRRRRARDRRARAASWAWTRDECAAGIVRVAEAEMLRALRVMTVERGIDPREYALMPFGGAGPLHACALAEELGIDARALPAHVRRAVRARPGRRRAAAGRVAHGDAARMRCSASAVARVRDELLAQAGSADAAARRAVRGHGNRTAGARARAH